MQPKKALQLTTAHFGKTEMAHLKLLFVYHSYAVFFLLKILDVSQIKIVNWN